MPQFVSGELVDLFWDWLMCVNQSRLRRSLLINSSCFEEHILLLWLIDDALSGCELLL